MAKTREGAFRCKGGFAATLDGTRVVVPDGALVPFQFPYQVMDGREQLFVDIGRPQVERATAAPGEVRPRRRRRTQPEPTPEPTTEPTETPSAETPKVETGPEDAQ